MRLFGQALSEDSTYAALWVNLGSAFLEGGDLDRTLHCLNEALKVRPAFVEAWYLKGKAFAAGGRPRDAESCFERSLALRPAFTAARRELEALREMPA